MKCISCEVEIDPKWKHALDSNVCPFCGESIMPNDLKEHISNLSIILGSFKESYPNQLDDWLLSNHNYVKTDGEKIKQFFPEPKIVYRSAKASDQEDSSEEEDENLIAVQNQDFTSKFFKNAEVTKTVARAEELKRMVSEIKSNNPSLNRSQLNQDEDFEDDQQDINSSINADYDEQIPPVVMAFSNQRRQGSSDYSNKDVIRLQQLQNRVSESRRNVVNGTGGKGSFSRSG